MVLPARERGRFLFLALPLRARALNMNASRRDVSRLPGGRSDGKEQSKNNRLSPLIKIA
jgi:hypothetical protein